MTHYVLDACALVAVLKGENGAEAVDDLFSPTLNPLLPLCPRVVAKRFLTDG